MCSWASRRVRLIKTAQANSSRQHFAAAFRKTRVSEDVHLLSSTNASAQTLRSGGAEQKRSCREILDVNGRLLRLMRRRLHGVRHRVVRGMFRSTTPGLSIG